MLLLATSCLQGMPLVRACLELLALQPDGLQLCPGHPPSPGLRALLCRVQTRLQTHHGFSWSVPRAPVWDAAGQPLVPLDDRRSLHPPRTLPPQGLEAWLAQAAAARWTLEIMPPGWILSDELAIDAALAHGVSLAVDVSHLHILRTAGRLSAAGTRRLLDAPHISEIHVSESDGRLDLHRALSPDTYGVGWALERTADAVPMVLECYLHRLDDAARRHQIERLRP